jgi:solute carrier family 25 (mitochondrial phosphate transporter), member 23/24/25/41
MMVTTMVTKSKDSWSLQLPELSFPWKSHEGRNDVKFPHCALFTSVSLNMPPPVTRDPLEHDRKARPTDNCNITRQLEDVVKGKQEGEVEEETREQQKKKKGTSGKTQLYQVGAPWKKLVRVKIGNPHRGA